jgi:hypothetical protein
MSENMMECETAFAVPGKDGIIDVIRPSTGLSWCYGHNLEQIRARYPGAEIVNCDEHFAAQAKRQDSTIEWMETTREKYWEMLEVLPPACMLAGGFLVGEPMDHHAGTGHPRFSAFRSIGSRYFESNRPLTVKEFKSFYTDKSANTAKKLEVA